MPPRPAGRAGWQGPPPPPARLLWAPSSAPADSIHSRDFPYHPKELVTKTISSTTIQVPDRILKNAGCDKAQVHATADQTVRARQRPHALFSQFPQFGAGFTEFSPPHPHPNTHTLLRKGRTECLNTGQHVTSLKTGELLQLNVRQTELRTAGLLYFQSCSRREQTPSLQKVLGRCLQSDKYKHTRARAHTHRGTRTYAYIHTDTAGDQKAGSKGPDGGSS